MNRMTEKELAMLDYSSNSDVAVCTAEIRRLWAEIEELKKTILQQTNMEAFLRSQLSKARKILKRLEYITDHENETLCTICGWLAPEHSEHCELYILLKALSAGSDIMEGK